MTQKRVERSTGVVDLRYFNQTGWTAIFDGTETEIGRMVRVEAWDPATETALDTLYSTTYTQHSLNQLDAGLTE